MNEKGSKMQYAAGQPVENRDELMIMSYKTIL